LNVSLYIFLHGAIYSLSLKKNQIFYKYFYFLLTKFKLFLYNFFPQLLDIMKKIVYGKTCKWLLGITNKINYKNLLSLIILYNNYSYNALVKIELIFKVNTRITCKYYYYKVPMCYINI